MKSEILSILKDLRPEFEFETSNNFIEDGYLDSFDIVTLVSEIEEKFDVLIDGIEILPENFNSLDSIEKLIRKNM